MIVMASGNLFTTRLLTTHHVPPPVDLGTAAALLATLMWGWQRNSTKHQTGCFLHWFIRSRWYIALDLMATNSTKPKDDAFFIRSSKYIDLDSNLRVGSCDMT
jgi:hypothetical protein